MPTDRSANLKKRSLDPALEKEGKKEHRDVKLQKTLSEKVAAKSKSESVVPVKSDAKKPLNLPHASNEKSNSAPHFQAKTISAQSMLSCICYLAYC
jgi:hypothetical protein